MKRTFLLITFVSLYFTVYGQSLSFTELKDSINHGFYKNSAYLTAKGFSIGPAESEIEAFSVFKKNERKATEEIIEYSKGGLAYESKDLNYIKNLLRQVKAKYKLTHITRQTDPHNDHASGTRYELTTGKYAVAFILLKNYGIIGFDFVRPYWQ